MKTMWSLIALLVCTSFADQNGRSKLDANVQKAVTESWNDVVVKTDKNGWMWIVTTQNTVKDMMYTAVLMQACLEINENKAARKKLKKVMVLNKFKLQGYVFEQPIKCSELVDAPMGKESDRMIISMTHLYMGEKESEMTGE